MGGPAVNEDDALYRMHIHHGPRRALPHPQAVSALSLLAQAGCTVYPYLAASQ